ncbi:MAG: hypothetical protein COA42_22030 [Alteromonadaceae bacterium]|nr:MAG: hypothetical protein COA42_22030 [Alteromonadaceae bacterium]
MDSATYLIHPCARVVHFGNSTQFQILGRAFTIAGFRSIFEEFFNSMAAPKEKQWIQNFFITHAGEINAGKIIKLITDNYMLLPTDTKKEPKKHLTHVLDIKKKQQAYLSADDTQLKNLRQIKTLSFEGIAEYVKSLGETAKNSGEFQVCPPNDADFRVFIAANHAEYIDANERLIANKAPFLLAMVEDLQLNIGPLVLPGMSACGHCVISRQYANKQYKQEFVARCQTNFELPPAHPVQTGLLSALIYAEILKFQTGDSNSYLVNKVLNLSWEDWSSERNHVLRVPRCAHCSPLKTQRYPAVRDLME